MSTYLISVSVGPVQEFIYTARRTRDLWFASTVLSEVSLAAAKTLAEAGAELIFPAEPVTWGESGARSVESDGRKVSNKLLALLPEGSGRGPALLAEDVRAAAQERWLALAEEARGRCKELGVALDEERWEEQVRDVIEVYAAWAPLANGDYPSAHARVERILAGRKMLRDFQQATGHAGVPKSSLDGAREAVIHPSSLPASVLRRAGLKKLEYLDSVGVVKRFGGGRKSFVPVCRVAADPWIRGVAGSADPEVKEAFVRIREAAQQLNGMGMVSPVLDPASYQHFPYEGETLFVSRLREMREEAKEVAGRSGPDADAELGILQAANEIAGQLKAIKEKGFGEPSPYLAVLMGDGDRMGAVISRLGSAERHREFSRRVAEFADMARTVIVACYGALVYSGGDDVLAFVPVDKCLASAALLRRSFDDIVARAVGDDPPTFSVGIAIGHYLEPLGDLLSLAREAERKAKDPDRDALAIMLKTRSGGEPLSFRGKWTADPCGRLERIARLYLTGELPDRAGFHLRELAREYRLICGTGPVPEDLAAALGSAAAKEACRVLRRKTGEAGRRLSVEVVDELLEGVCDVQSLAALADRLILARHLAAAMRQVIGSSAPVADDQAAGVTRNDRVGEG